LRPGRSKSVLSSKFTDFLYGCLSWQHGCYGNGPLPSAEYSEPVARPLKKQVVAVRHSVIRPCEVTPI
jgi:hypothetical protein